MLLTLGFWWWQDGTLLSPRRAQRAWEAAGEVAESRGHSKGPPKGASRRKGGKSREKLGRNLLAG